MQNEMTAAEMKKNQIERIQAILKKDLPEEIKAEYRVLLKAVEEV